MESELILGAIAVMVSCVLSLYFIWRKRNLRRIDDRTARQIHDFTRTQIKRNRRGRY